MQDPRLLDKNQPRDVDPALMCFPEDPPSLALDLHTVPPINGRFIATQAVGVFLATSSIITTPIPGHSKWTKSADDILASIYITYRLAMLAIGA
ncbi:hypothetical protein SAMN05216338_107616 [Bradyrhizobium sp. Rc2d]|uniref:hypothetical protein n=1 Tax=Bradyrhizobium sp. Rc2d TaxID=1855321 RepID=UPI000883F445|nr:hypothetical protein [Bradyrhizobium sp. Rc2d]SDJ96441.1 hypothetical protein SAMN05216338_107616 [Bradyrhizobium sp. Rc2d]